MARLSAKPTAACFVVEYGALPTCDNNPAAEMVLRK
jgi:hypothetical protein